MSAHNILVLGATGGTGRAVVSQALAQGQQVTVLARHPERLDDDAPRVRVVTAALPENQGALEGAMLGQDAVISTLGVGTSLNPRALIARSAPAIVRAMEASGVRRLIFTSAYGVGETWRDVPILPRIAMRLFLADVYADKLAGEEAIERSSLDWTLVHPVTLTNAPRTGRLRAGERLALRGFPTVSRADVAQFLLAQLDDRTYVRKHVLVSS